MFIDILLDALLDTLKTVPFLFLAYLLMESFEHRAEDKSLSWVGGSGKWGPVIGSALGLVPQCGFSAATANLYAGGLISRGTLLAVFLSTSDEMLPILISRQAPAGLILKVLAYKFLAAVICGLAVDAVSRRRGARNNWSVEDLCEQEGCHCEDSVLKSALFHTGKISLFLFITSLLLGLAVEAVGAEHLAHFILNKPVIGECLAGIVGLIPNCAASVVITELYLQGGMSLGALLSGLLTAAGVGTLLLFRTHKDLKENLVTLGLLYGFGVLFGLLGGFLAG